MNRRRFCLQKDVRPIGYSMYLPPKVNKMKLRVAAAGGNGWYITGAFIMDSFIGLFSGISLTRYY